MISNDITLYKNIICFSAIERPRFGTHDGQTKADTYSTNHYRRWISKGKVAFMDTI